MVDVGRCLLADILLQKKITQQELANRIGVTKQQIGHYANDRRVMSLPIAVNIAIVLGCDIKDLYEWKHVEVRTKRR